MSPSDDAPVRVILPIGQSETARLFRSGPFYTQGEYPALAEHNVTVIINDVNWLKSPGVVVREVNEATIAAREVTPAMVALANFWNEVRPGERLVVLDGTVSGTSFHELMNDEATKRQWSDFEDVVQTARGMGHEVDDVIWDWYNSTAGHWQSFGESYSPGIFGQDADGSTYDLGPATVFDHTLFDADVDFDEYGRGLFARAETRLSVMSPGPSVEAFLGAPRRNFTHLEEGGQDKGRVSQLDRPAIEAGAAFMADPRLGPAAGANGPAPVVVKFGDYQDGAKLPSGDTDIHPSGQSIHGTPLWAMHIGVAALIASGDAGEPQVMGQRTAADGSYTDVLVSLPNGGVLSTLREVTGRVSPDPVPSDHQQADGTGFELRRAGDADGDRRPVWRPGAEGRDPAYAGQVEVLDDGSGAGAERMATLRIHWETPVSDGAVLEYMRGGHFAAQLTRADYDRELWADFLIEHVPDWHDGTQFGYPGVPVRPQPPVELMTLRLGEATGAAVGRIDPGPSTPPPLEPPVEPPAPPAPQPRPEPEPVPTEPVPDPDPPGSPAPPPASAFEIRLVDTGADADIGTIVEGGTIAAGVAPGHRGIVASWIGDGDAGDDDGSIRFELRDASGALLREKMESIAPFAIFGDAKGDYRDASPPLPDGAYELRLTAYSENSGRGTVLGTETVGFTIGPATPEPQPATPTPEPDPPVPTPEPELPTPQPEPPAPEPEPEPEPEPAPVPTPDPPGPAPEPPAEPEPAPEPPALRPEPGTVLFRINAGGPAVAASDGGPEWSADQAATAAGALGKAQAGTPSPFVVLDGGQRDMTRGPYGSILQAPNATDAPDAVFATNRLSTASGPDGLAWRFELPDGDYLARLFFAEWFPPAEAPGTRVFDVSVEGRTALDDFDMAAVHGVRVAGVQEIAVDVSDGALDIAFHRDARHPYVNAIEILTAAASSEPASEPPAPSPSPEPQPPTPELEPEPPAPEPQPEPPAPEPEAPAPPSAPEPSPELEPEPPAPPAEPDPPAPEPLPEPEPPASDPEPSAPIEPDRAAPEPGPATPEPSEPTDASGPQAITVWAAGTTVRGRGPEFSVRVDGEEVGAARVDAAKPSFEGNYEAFVFDLGGRVPGTVSIRFGDDAWIRPGGPDRDRNLWVDRIEIGETVLEAETHGRVVSDNARLAARYDWDGPTEAMYANGVMLFEDLGPF